MCPELCFCAFKLFLRLLFSYQSSSAGKKIINFPLLSFHKYYYCESFQKNVSYLQLDVATSCHSRRHPCCLRQMDALISFLLLCFAVLQFVKNSCLFCLNGVLVMLLWYADDPGWDHTCILSGFREIHVRKRVFIKAVLFWF